MAYVAKANSRRFVVVDGKEFGPYFQVRDVFFNEDGTSYGLTAREDGTTIAVVDGEKVASSNRNNLHLALSPDGLGYVHAEEGNATLYVNGQPAGTYAGRAFSASTSFEADLPPVLFSPGGALTYAEAKGRQTVLLHVGDRSWTLPGMPGRITFSPDGAHFASSVQAKDPETDQYRHMLMVNGKMGPGYDLLLSPWTITAGNVLQFIATRGDEIHRVRVRLDDV